MMTNTGRTNRFRKLKFINEGVPKYGKTCILVFTIRNTTIIAYRSIRNCSPGVNGENLMAAYMMRSVSCKVISKYVLKAISTV